MTPTPQTLALFDAQAAIEKAEREAKFPGFEFHPREFDSSWPEEQRIVSRCAEVMEQELSTLRSQLDALATENNSNADNRKLLAEDLVALTKGLPCKLHLAQQVHALIDGLHSQLDALKTEVVRKDGAIQRTLKYLRSPEDESAEMIERLLDNARAVAKEAGR